MLAAISALIGTLIGTLGAATAPQRVHADDWDLQRGAPRSPGRVRSPQRARDAALGAQSTGVEATGAAQDVQRARYLDLVLRQPSDQSAFERLTALYRARDGNLDGLQLELTARAQEGHAKAASAHALLLLQARVQQALGQLDAARAGFDAARDRAPQDPLPYILAAKLEQDAGQLERARELLTAALARTSDREGRRDALERLAELALALKDFAAAERAFGELAGMQKQSAFAATALARALSAQGEHARAAEAYARALTGLHGDPRVLAPIQLEQARSELEAGEHARAIETLARIERSSAGEGVRYGAFDLLLEAHRRAGTLDALEKTLEAKGTGSFESAERLARVQEELGHHAQAERSLQRALARNPKHAQTRERLVRLLLREGRLREAIAEQQKLVKAAPGEPQYVTSLAQALLEAGMRDDALKLLEQTEQRFARDARVTRALLDLYSRWGEQARAGRMLERLARLEPHDPSHLLALGRELLDRGDEKGSQAAFARAIEGSLDRAQAHAALGEVLLDSDRPAAALEQLERAVKLRPDDAQSVRGLAEALERMKRFVEAETQWRKVMELGDAAEHREARRRIVLLWSQTGELRRQARELELAFAGQSRAPAQAGAPAKTTNAPQPVAPAPDLEAGRFLAECYRVLASVGRHGSADPDLLRKAEGALARILELAPGDVETMLALERARSARRDLRGASAMLEKLLQADPNHAATYLGRLAEYALLEYRDVDAIAYAERLVALAPNDANAHVRLGELYRGRQDLQRAVLSYERAVELDPTAYAARATLADLLLAVGPHADIQARADGLLRQVVAGSPDDELVRRAARALFQLHAGDGTLAALEPALLGLAMRADRPIHRELLLELYLAITQPLLAAIASHGDGAAAAREQLGALGRRAIKPLLEALAGADPSARAVAIDVLGVTGNSSALLPLLDAAERPSDMSVRRKALLAVGMLASEAVTPRLLALATGEESRLRDLAAWGLARAAIQGSKKAAAALLPLTQSDVPAVRGYALLGLSRASSKELIARALSALEHDRNPWVRGAAALALGHAQTGAHAAELIAALQVETDEVAASAALALGMLRAPRIVLEHPGSDRSAARALTTRIFDGSTWSPRAAAWALARLEGAAGGGALPGAAAPLVLDPPAERVALSPLLASHLEHAGLQTLKPSPELSQALAAALAARGSSARNALRTLLGTLSSADARLPGWSPSLTYDLLKAVLAPLEALALHGDLDTRAVALELLIRSAPDRGQAALAQTLAEPEPATRELALDVLARQLAPALPPLSEAGLETDTTDSRQALASALSILAARDPLWPLRQKAVRLLAQLLAGSAPRSAGAGGHERELGAAQAILTAQATLSAVLERDPNAYVRQAAAQALASLVPAEGGAASSVLRRAAEGDPEARVREEATGALAKLRSAPR